MCGLMPWKQLNRTKMFTYHEDLRTRRGLTEKLYKKDLNDPDNHNGVTTHLESDILECKVNWALGSNTTNKASGDD